MSQLRRIYFEHPDPTSGFDPVPCFFDIERTDAGDLIIHMWGAIVDQRTISSGTHTYLRGGHMERPEWLDRVIQAKKHEVVFDQEAHAGKFEPNRVIKSDICNK